MSDADVKLGNPSEIADLTAPRLKVLRNARTFDQMSGDKDFIPPVGVNAFSLAGEIALITGVVVSICGLP